MADFRGSRKPLSEDNARTMPAGVSRSQKLTKYFRRGRMTEEPRQGGASELSRIWPAVVIVTLSATSVLKAVC